MRPWISLLLAASAVALAQPALAAPPAAPAQTSKPDEATVAEAIRLLDVDEFDAGALRASELMMGVSLAGMVDALHKQFGEAVPEDFITQLRTLIHDHGMATMRAHLPEMKRKAAEIYASEFTRDELIRLRQLHSDPVAVKARQRSPAMEPKLAEIGVRAMQSGQPELEAKIDQLVKEYQAKQGKASAPSS